MTIQLRPHRGTLEDSLREAVILSKFSEIRDYVIEHWSSHVGNIEYCCYDSRLKGETFLITDSENRAIGFAVLLD